MHEAQLHEENSFVTLTYDEAHLPYGGTLVKKHFVDFMKRLRRPYAARKVRYLMCGEYGDACRICRRPERRCICPGYIPGPGRPHYHALLFGLSFGDRTPYEYAVDGSELWTSETLSRLWPFGFHTVGALTFESAAYVARYCMKKVNGDPAEEHYTITLPDSGEIIRLEPEYATRSLKPAIAKDWYGKFSTDVYPDDFVVMRGKKMKPPKYYDKLHELHHPEAHAEIKRERTRYAATQKTNATPERLAVREKVTRARMSQTKRSLE